MSDASDPLQPPAERGRRARTGARDARPRARGKDRRLAGRPRPARRRGRADRRRRPASAIPTSPSPSTPAAPFRRRRADAARGDAATRPRRLRSRHPLGAARRRRRARLALRRSGHRRDLRPLRGPRRRQPAHVRSRRARRSRQRSSTETLGRGLPGRRGQSPGRPRRPRRPCSAGSARRCWRGRTCSPAAAPAGSTTVLAARAEGGRLPAPAILELLLEALGPIWADRLVIDGIPLGDCWRHPAIRRDDASDGLVPLHKLSQWLCLFADRAARGGGHRGRRDGRTHRPRRISQRRPVRRHRRARPRRSRRRRPRAPGLGPADRRLARR